ncbi:stomatin-like protein 1 isoform X2 [Anarrhichthys ocellatus]|uniref:stomatin-like protein 1 isoform X2 n=1 Tax=Anarrhichthys ocellatus TaxID=433405 RepID=UPI0012ECBACB|nr:stomatin-like protein 1 isoform X2 [Anarrhichthys ocellatus]
MFSKSYQLLPQKDTTSPRTPGLFVDTDSFTQRGYYQGFSFDNIPNVPVNNFTDTSQGWLSWICNLIVIFLVYIFTFITFPITGWFVLKVITLDDGMLSVGADIQFRIWSPVKSVLSVQDLNASTRMTAQKALTYSLAKKTVREIQTGRVKLGDYLVMDINEMTRPWGLEVDRVELTLGSLLKAPGEGPSGPLIMPPSMPGVEGLTGSIQQLAMQFLSQSGILQPQKDDSITFTDELSSAPQEVVATSGSVDELLGRVQLVLSETLVHQVGACFQFNISSEDGQHHSYYVDLSQGSGAAGAGYLFREPDVTLSLSDSDLLAMFQGGLQPFAAYTSGRLQLQGDIKTAMKLEELIKLLKDRVGNVEKLESVQ